MFLTIKDAEKTYDLSSLRHCISAGEPLNPEVIKEWKRRFGIDAYDGIGMTEVMVYVSNMRDMKIKLGSCGKPQPGHHLRASRRERHTSQTRGDRSTCREKNRPRIIPGILEQTRENKRKLPVGTGSCPVTSSTRMKKDTIGSADATTTSSKQADTASRLSRSNQPSSPIQMS